MPPFGLAHRPKSMSLRFLSPSISKFSYDCNEHVLMNCRNIKVPIKFSYRFKVPMCIAMVMNIRNRRDNLSEENS